jgi:hypothetical protein
MKKISILVFLLLISITSVGATTNYDYEYTKYAEASEDYQRIEKFEDKWYGVISVTNLYLEYVSWAGSPGTNNMFIQFDRDVEFLESIKVKYTTEDYCNGVNIVWCIGTIDKSHDGVLELYNKHKDGGVTEIFALDSITTTNKENYDYVVFASNTVPYSHVDVIEFTYLLTAVEIENLKLDIQHQYEVEFNMIINNDTLSSEEVNSLIVQLNHEYSSYDVSYGELMTSECVGDECEVDSSNSDEHAAGATPEWVQSTIDAILKGATAIIGGFFAISVAGVIAYMIFKKVVSLTGIAAVGTIKATARAGGWWGSQIGEGIITVFSIIGRGIKAFPVIIPIIILLIITLIILL